MTQQPPTRPPTRVRVTSPWTDRPRAAPRRTATSEIDAQSEVGEIYLRALLRAQLRAGLTTLAVLVLTIGSLPLVFALVPTLTRWQLLGMPVSWGVLAFGCYPVLVALAWRYVRVAERNERAFARTVQRQAGQAAPHRQDG